MIGAYFVLNFGSALALKYNSGVQRQAVEPAHDSQMQAEAAAAKASRRPRQAELEDPEWGHTTLPFEPITLIFRDVRYAHGHQTCNVRSSWILDLMSHIVCCWL